MLLNQTRSSSKSHTNDVSFQEQLAAQINRIEFTEQTKHLDQQKQRIK